MQSNVEKIPRFLPKPKQLLSRKEKEMGLMWRNITLGGECMGLHEPLVYCINVGFIFDKSKN